MSPGNSLLDKEDKVPDVGKIVIVGAGIIGAATAHYLADLGLGPQVTVVEREEVACAASGKAGGFLALDWNDTSVVRSLARASYALHEDLAELFGADVIGYRPVRTFSVAAQEKPGGGKSRFPGKQLVPAWVDGQVLACASMGSEKTTAQVHPGKLTHALIESATRRGARLVHGRAAGVELSSSRRVTGLKVDGGPEPLLPADVLVIAMGPWCGEAATQWGLAVPTVKGHKAHSVVLRHDPQQPIGAEMLFTNYTYADGHAVEPEVCPRPDGSVYVCGESGSGLEVPPAPSQVVVDEGRCDNLVKMAGSIASRLQGAELVARQACYLPTGPDGLPIIGAVPDTEGVYMATGHTCWGILNGPATGKALAELIAHGSSKTVDLKPFAPSRFFAGARK